MILGTLIHVPRKIPRLIRYPQASARPYHPEPRQAAIGLDIGRVRVKIKAVLATGVDDIHSPGTAGEFHCHTEDEFDRVAH